MFIEFQYHFFISFYILLFTLLHYLASNSNKNNVLHDADLKNIDNYDTNSDTDDSVAVEESNNDSEASEQIFGNNTDDVDHTIDVCEDATNNEEKQLTKKEYEFELFKKTEKYKFLTKYKLNKNENNICCKEKNNNDIVFEYIPMSDSIVIMGYDFENSYFQYWSNKSTPFYVLNIVSIKYINEFNRSYLFLDNIDSHKEKSNDDLFINTETKLENKYTLNHFKHRGKLNELNVLLEVKKKNTY